MKALAFHLFCIHCARPFLLLQKYFVYRVITVLYFHYYRLRQQNSLSCLRYSKRFASVSIRVLGSVTYRFRVLDIETGGLHIQIVHFLVVTCM